MVSIFDDDVDEVGAEIEAFCPKCKADTTHVIISKYEDEIRRVQCNPCSDVHAYRKPRGEVDEEPPEPIAAKKRAAKVKPTWDQVMAKTKKQPKLYVIAEQFHENELISHPKFGIGFVSEVIGLDKMEVTFQTEKRVLVHNKQGMSLPPAAYAHVVNATLPGTTDKRKGALKQAVAKAAAGKAQPVKAAKGKPEAKPAAKKPEPAKASPKKPEAKKPEAKKPAPKPAAKKPAARPAPKKPVAKKSAPKKPAPKPAAKKPTIKPQAAKSSPKAAAKSSKSKPAKPAKKR